VVDRTSEEPDDATADEFMTFGLVLFPSDELGERDV
jgi:hypothetical protein